MWPEPRPLNGRARCPAGANLFWTGLLSGPSQEKKKSGDCFVFDSSALGGGEAQLHIRKGRARSVGFRVQPGPFSATWRTREMRVLPRLSLLFL